MKFHVGQRVVAIGENTYKDAPGVDEGDNIRHGDVGTVIAVDVGGWAYEIAFDNGITCYASGDKLAPVDDDRDATKYETAREYYDRVIAPRVTA